ncbi:hypothetical protein J6590_094739 [Homalodisca vitripennis]|nr:hypothetical protein J6590_080898 [Homalodisca vitripennis]KAG8316536.1 hypothetical protein J6590_048706 [Homalodisca vitripennis]KAG8319305.1 hypothetical protein J6590_094739 [Homalodisca vitripennis]
MKWTVLSVAAYAKYQQIGDMAPWAKLILPPEEVQEFNADKLRTIFSVARALSTRYGSSTTRQLERASKSNTTERIIEQPLKIVAYSGGARTVDAMAIRIWKLNGHANRTLVRELDTAALNEPIEQAIEDGAEIVQRMGEEP